VTWIQKARQRPLPCFPVRNIGQQPEGLVQIQGSTKPFYYLRVYSNRRESYPSGMASREAFGGAPLRCGSARGPVASWYRRCSAEQSRGARVVGRGASHRQGTDMRIGSQCVGRSGIPEGSERVPLSRRASASSNTPNSRRLSTVKMASPPASPPHSVPSTSVQPWGSLRLNPSGERTTMCPLL